MVNKAFYNTVLSQVFSPCGNYLFTGDIYGYISVFNLAKVIKPVTNLSKEDQSPINVCKVQEGVQINSMVSTESHLIVGTVGEIAGFQWNTVKNTKDGKPAWKIELQASQDSFDKADINCMLVNKEAELLYAGCGNNKIYIFNLSNGKTLKTLNKHTNYIHCLFKYGNDLISGGEDGVVNIWDLRDKTVVNSLKPYTNDKIARPDLGRWIGAVGLNDDWLLCGGGPRLALWHYRSLNTAAVFPIDDKGIHVAEFYGDKIFAGGRSKLFYQMNINGDIVTEIPTSSVTVYSAVHQEEPFKALCIAGSSPKIDVCSNFNYRDQVLYLY